MSPDSGPEEERRASLARDLLEAEGLSDADTGSAADAVAVVLERLHRRLQSLIGAGGYETVLGRAVVITVKRHPRVDRLPLPDAGAPSAQDLERALRDVPDGESGEIAATLVREFLAFLARLVGWKLVLVILWDPWPEVAERYDAPTLNGGDEPMREGEWS